MEDADWVPPELDISVPSIARVYDYFLGGSHNFASDRKAAQETLAALPNARLGFYEARSFLQRAVEYLVGQGVTQFLDIGSGIPTVGNVHEIAQASDPDARVVYVDIDPIAVAHSRAILKGNDRAGVVQADIREPERVLADPQTVRLLDFDQPVALLMCAILHFLPDADDPVGLVGRYRDRLSAGSYLVISHASLDETSMRERLTGWKAAYDSAVATFVTRSRAEVAALFGDMELVDPGVVWMSQWHPYLEAPPTEIFTGYGGVGRKP